MATMKKLPALSWTEVLLITIGTAVTIGVNWLVSFTRKEFIIVTWGTIVTIIVLVVGYVILQQVQERSHCVH